MTFWKTLSSKTITSWRRGLALQHMNFEWTHYNIYVYEREVAQSCPTLFDPMDCSLLGSSIHGISPGDLSDPEIEPRSPALQEVALPPEPPGKRSHQSRSNRKLKFWRSMAAFSLWSATLAVQYTNIKIHSWQNRAWKTSTRPSLPHQLRFHVFVEIHTSPSLNAGSAGSQRNFRLVRQDRQFVLTYISQSVSQVPSSTLQVWKSLISSLLSIRTRTHLSST